jgi:NagD protein
MTTPTINTPTTEFASVDETRDLAASFAASLGQQQPQQQQPQQQPQQSQQHGAVTPHGNEDGISARDWALFRDPVLHNERLEAIRQKKGFIIDMDGVIYHVCI